MHSTDFCHADLGNTISLNCEYVVYEYPLGTAIFRSPEIALPLLPFGLQLMNSHWGECKYVSISMLISDSKLLYTG